MTENPPAVAVLETALYVADRARSAAFYEALFGFRRCLDDEKRLIALSVDDRQVLLLFERGKSINGEETPGGKIPGHDGQGRQHLAFAIDAGDVEDWKRRLADAGIAIESVVRPPRGGTCVYFRDPDDHLIELATPGVWDFR